MYIKIPAPGSLLISLFVCVLLLIQGCQIGSQDDAADQERKREVLKHDRIEKSNKDANSIVNTQKKAVEISEQRGIVRRNDSFFRIFTRLGITQERIYNLTNRYERSLQQFQLKPGQKYRYRMSKTDSTKKVLQFTWMPSQRDMVIIDFKDSLSVTTQRKSIQTKFATAEGLIESSLFETFQEKELSIELAYKLSELFAWQIDFFLLREGDAFKVMYTEEYVDGEKIGLGDIIAARFSHRDNTFHAYRFYNGKEMGYYDQNGESLQKALLKAPLRFRYISSGYSHNRYHPILHRRMPHYGIDYVAPRGTPVVTVGDGTVVKAGYKGANGNMVKIKHNNTYSTTYIHLSRFGDGIRRGAEVKQGEVIGYVGSTGRSTGPHLDYRLYKNGRPVNPRTIDLPPTKSIDSTLMKAFHYATRQMERELEALEFNQTNVRPGNITESNEISNGEDDAEKNS